MPRERRDTNTEQNNANRRRMEGPPAIRQLSGGGAGLPALQRGAEQVAVEVVETGR